MNAAKFNPLSQSNPMQNGVKHMNGTLNQRVAGSSPARFTKFFPFNKSGRF